MNQKKKTIGAIAVIAAITALLAGGILISGESSGSREENHAAGKHDEAQEGKQADKDHGEHGKEGKEHEEHKEHKEHKEHNEHEEDTHGNTHGNIAFNDEQIKAAGIVVASAGPVTIVERLRLPGEIRVNADRTAHIVPRVAGVVESVAVNLGQQVKRGDLLATINSSAVGEQRGELIVARQRLALAKTTYLREKELWEEKISARQDYLEAQQKMREAEIAAHNARRKLDAIGADAGNDASNRYRIRAPFDGTVIEKHLALGESVKEDADIFMISDLSTVWTEVIVPAGDLKAVRSGAEATVHAMAFEATAKGRISTIGVLLGEQSRTAKANIVLPNPDQSWRPGLFVNVEISSGQAQVPVAVTSDALQSIEGKNVVFIRTPDGFAAREVRLGRGDTSHVEIVDGLTADTPYAAAGSFALKAELGKNSAEHSH